MQYSISWQYPGDETRHAVTADGVAANQLVSALRMSGAVLVSVEGDGAARHAKPRVDEPLIGADALRARDVIRTWPDSRIPGDPNQP